MSEEMYYQKNYKQYFESTVHIDPTHFLSPLVEVLKSGAKIFDIGCGAGRDLLWLHQRGFQVIGLELSPGLARLARQHSGCSVIEGDFSQYNFSSLLVDALIFIGSLVHQPKENVSSILQSSCQALVNGGYVLLTMKEGHQVSMCRDGRKYFLWNKTDLEEVLSACNLQVITFSRQISKLHPDDTWLGYLLQFSH